MSSEEIPKEHKKSIRSYVLRQGRMTKAQDIAFEKFWPTFGIDFQHQGLNVSEIYQNENQKFVIEIGFGNGLSLVEMAERYPEKNFLGIEVHKPGVGVLLQEVGRLGLKNIKCMNHDAIEVFKEMIPDQSVDAIQLFFPDPWPKKKHHKRRIVKKEFLDLISLKLKPAGYFHMATDWWPYAEDAMEVLSAFEGLKNKAEEKQFSPRPDFRPLTKFEERGVKLGHGVWDLIFEKA